MSLDPNIRLRFPNLESISHRVTSPESSAYNCMAWAAGDASQWWWPGPLEDDYWPAAVPREETLDSFKAMFEGMGYSECLSADLEPGFEKVAVFVDSDGIPTHAARQLSSGWWTSKLGDRQDIEHESLTALEDSPWMRSPYGMVAIVMRRPSESQE